MKLHIAIIGTVGVPANYGGFESLVENLLNFNPHEINYTVFCSSSAYLTKQYNYKGAKLKYLPFKANGFSSLVYDGVSLMQCIGREYNVILILGVSGAIFIPFIKPFLKSKIICNIDGIEWKRDKWNFITKIFLKFSEKLAVGYADEIVADNVEIQNYLKNVYNIESELITYGGDHATSLKISKAILYKYPFLQQDYAFKVCRIEPENNIDIILEAFSLNPNFHLVIIGNWSNSTYGINLKSNFSKFNHIHLIDPIYDIYILNQIRSNCFVYIHGHSAGGTNPSLVEAMSLKLPIIAFDCNFNRSTTDNKCLYFHSTQTLFDIIINIKSFDLNTISENMFYFANNNYRWELITSKYLYLFNK